MNVRDGQFSTVIKGTVGTGGVTKGDLVVLSGNTFVKAAAAPTAATVIGISLGTYAATAVGKFELAQGRIVTAVYTGSTKTSVTDADISKVFDLTDSQTVNLDDTTGGVCYCVDYDNDLKLIDFILTPASRAV